MSEVYTERGGFIAGFYGANKRGFARYVKRVCWNGKWTWFITTESYGKVLYFLRVLMPLWRITRRGEYVIGTRRDRWGSTRMWRYDRLSHQYDGRETWKDTFLYRRTAIHRKSRRHVLFGGIHTQAGIENGSRYKAGRQADGHREGLANLGKLIAELEAKRPDLGIAFGMDGNANQHDREWRDVFAAAVGLPSMWDDERPPKGVGTHAGGRLIDVVFSNLPMSNPRISRVKRPPRVDHKAVAVTLHIAAKEAA